MKKIGNKGLSVVELIVSFVLCILVYIFIIQVVSALEELYVNLGIKTALLNRQTIISEKINSKLTDNKIVLVKNCGEDCLIFFHEDNTFNKIQINKEKNTFIVDEDTYDFSGLGFVDSLTASVTNDYAYSEAILTIDLNIKNSIFDDNKYIIRAYYQYNVNETVYSSSSSNKAEIFLLGPAVSYKFSEDLFIEPGWIVFYPSGRVVINGDDVKSSGLEYDKDGNAFVRYTGVGDAAGSEKTRTIQSYKTAKDFIIDSYSSNSNGDIYLYSELGRYVYKGSDPNNYIAIGSKLFRIISLDIQQQYQTDEDGRIIVVDGVKQKENKYLLKVMSNNFLTDETGNELLPFGTIQDAAHPLFYMSAWYKNICNNNNCVEEGQYINNLVNDVYLQGLLNTGAGKLQIRNGTFNVGLVDWTTYRLSGFGVTRVFEYSAKEIFEVEGADITWGDGTTDLGKWNGDCNGEFCNPNAGIMSLTDILFASSDADCLDTIVIDNGVECVFDNWIWHQKGDTETRQFYRLMTRSTINTTWLLSELNYLSTKLPYDEYRTRATLYLDADLYIMGSGTKDSPYILYTMKKANN